MLKLQYQVFVLCLLVNQTHGNLKLVANCGKPADIGDSVFLTCNIYGTVANGITWQRGTDIISTCFQDRSCMSDFTELYRVGDDHHPSYMQQVTIIRATHDDFQSSFKCCDGPGCDVSSTCRLQKKTWATTEADCGERTYLGHSTVLRCIVTSMIHNGIQWYRDQKLIAQCDKQKKCISLDDDRFEVFKTHNDRNQQLIIKNVSKEDFSSQFTCVDNALIPPTLPSLSTCRLTQYYDTTTQVNCGPAVKLGGSVTLICTVLGTLANGVTWFRGKHGVVRCSQSNECYSDDIAKFNHGIDRNTIYLHIMNISIDDIKEPFSCYDNPEVPLTIPTDSTCNLRYAITSAVVTQYHSGELYLAVAVAVLLFQL